jgi:two-component system OmpR family response regulator
MASPGRVLVVTGDDFLADAVVHALRNDNHSVERAVSWRAAERLLPALRPQLVVIDSESEGLDARPVVDRVRLVTDVPLVLLSASSQPEDRLIGLLAGADEVMAKPFLLSELACKVTALIRRNGHQPTGFELGDLVVDEAAHTVARSGRPVELTSVEFALLVAFCHNCGLVLSKTQLLTMVWGFDYHNVNLVEVHVSALRRKLEAVGPRIIHTVRGVGYALRPVGVKGADNGNGRCANRSHDVYRPLRHRSLALA